MELPSSAFIPTGEVRSKIRQEQRLYDVQCALMLRDLNERRRKLEQSRRKMKLELDMLEVGVRQYAASQNYVDNPNGYQYTGYFPPPPGQPRDPDLIMYDVHVTRPRNRIPLRKVCTYRLDSMRDADKATPIVVEARRSLARLKSRNAISARNTARKCGGTSSKASSGSAASTYRMARSYSAPEYVPTEQQQIQNSELKAVGVTGRAITAPAEPGRFNVMNHVVKPPATAPSALQKARTFVRKNDAEIYTDINNILVTDESLRDRTRVVPPHERRLDPRKPTPKPNARHGTFVINRKTSPKLGKSTPGRISSKYGQPWRSKYRSSTPLPAGEDLSGFTTSEDSDGALNRVAIANGINCNQKQVTNGNEATEHPNNENMDGDNGDTKVLIQSSTNDQQPILEAERIVKLVPEKDTTVEVDTRDIKRHHDRAKTVVLETITKAIECVDSLNRTDEEIVKDANTQSTSENNGYQRKAGNSGSKTNEMAPAPNYGVTLTGGETSSTTEVLKTTRTSERVYTHTKYQDAMTSDDSNGPYDESCNHVHDGGGFSSTDDELLLHHHHHRHHHVSSSHNSSSSGSMLPPKAPRSNTYVAINGHHHLHGHQVSAQHNGHHPSAAAVAPTNRPRSASRKSSRVSFNEDVVVANYYDEGREDGLLMEGDAWVNVALWTDDEGEDDEDSEDVEIMNLYSPPSEAESYEEPGTGGQSLNGSWGYKYSSLVYSGTQRLKSYEGGNPTFNRSKPPISNAATTSKSKPKPKRPPVIAHAKKHKNGFLPLTERSKTFNRGASTKVVSIQATPNLNKDDLSGIKVLGQRGSGRTTAPKNSSRPSSASNQGVNSRPSTIRGTAKRIEDHMHNALACLDISDQEPSQLRTFTRATYSVASRRSSVVSRQGSAVSQQQQLCKEPIKTPEKGKRPDVIGGELRTPQSSASGGKAGPPSATEERQRQRRPSTQLLNMIEKRKASMSKSELLELEQARDKLVKIARERE